MATLRHPVTEAVIDIPDESSLFHYRNAGWQTIEEWHEQEAKRVEREAAAAAEAEAKARSTSKDGAKAAADQKGTEK